MTAAPRAALRQAMEQGARAIHGRCLRSASFAGEAYQFDWSHEVVLLNGVMVIANAARVRLCHNWMLFLRRYRHRHPHFSIARTVPESSIVAECKRGDRADPK
jgi:hypothetical protein